MNAPGKTMHDHLVQYARQLPDGSVLQFNNIQCECTMHTTQVVMDCGPRAEKYAPYLHLIGEVCHVTFPQEVTPYLHGIDALTFPEGAGLQTDVFYKFNRKELTDMVGKGYFDAKFEMPDIFNDNDFELPMSCNLMMVQPEREGDTPIIFVGLNNPRSMEFTSENSGYELGSYFENVPEFEPVVEELSDVQSELDADGVEFDDEFEGEGKLLDDDSVESELVTDDIADTPDFIEENVDKDEISIDEDEEDDTHQLMEHYAQVQKGVDTYANRTSKDVEHDIQVVSGQIVDKPVAEEPVAEEPVAEEPVAETVRVECEAVIDDDVDAVVSDESEEDEVVPDDDDIDSKDDRETPAVPESATDGRKSIPTGLEDVTKAADSIEYADDTDFADSL